MNTHAWALVAMLAGGAPPDDTGCVVGVIKDGRLIDVRADPLTATTVVDIASEAKQFTAACAILAAEQGHFTLDTDIRTHLPELADSGDVITIRHLLHHTSGIRDYVTLRILAGAPSADRHETLRLVARQRALNFRPGEAFLYSNSGYFLIGEIIERATGERLRDFAAKSIFEPLGMGATRFGESDDDVVGPGNLWTTLDDLARWDANFYGNALGTGSLLEHLLARGALSSGERLDYAAGLVIGDFDGMTTVSHGGASGGHRSMILRFQPLRLTVICLCNDGANAQGRAWGTAVRHALGQFSEETAALQTPGPAPVFVDLRPEQLDARAGAYRNLHTRQVWRVARRGGDLWIDDGRGGFGVGPLSAQRFRVRGRGQGIEIGFEAGALHIDIESQPTEVFEPVTLVTPEPAALVDLAGVYASSELEVEWPIVAREGKLFFDGPEAPKEPLTPTIADEFALGPELVVSFVRDERGEVVGLGAHTARVWHLSFEKRPR